jgi:hypothetical protein
MNDLANDLQKYVDSTKPRHPLACIAIFIPVWFVTLFILSIPCAVFIPSLPDRAGWALLITAHLVSIYVGIRVARNPKPVVARRGFPVILQQSDSGEAG